MPPYLKDLEMQPNKPILFEKTGVVNPDTQIETPLVVTEPPRIVINDEFLKKRPLSYSSLKHFSKSPKDYIWYLSQPYQAPSDSQIIGKAVECLVFEATKFPEKFQPYGDINRRTNEGKAQWEKLLKIAEINKKTLISETDIIKAEMCAQAVFNNHNVKPYVQAVTRTQIKLEWIDKKYNLPMIGYADMEGDYNGNFVGEFKTTQDGSDDGFPRQAFNFDYHIQIGTYSLGYHKKYYKFPNYFFIVVETTEPYKSNIFFCDPKYLEACREEVDYLLVSFRYCMDENMFHQGYEFWQQSMPYSIMKLPGYARLRSKI
jgi:hypothetical protein